MTTNPFPDVIRSAAKTGVDIIIVSRLSDNDEGMDTGLYVNSALLAFSELAWVEDKPMQLDLGLKMENRLVAWKSVTNAEKIILLNAIPAEAEAISHSPRIGAF